MSAKKTDLPIKIGISSCLLGEEVRFDSGHKKSNYIVSILGPYFQFVRVCPEVEIGMGVPREAVRLVGDPEAPRMVGGKTGTDWTRKMNRYSERRTGQIARYNLSGYILKKDSPSCGMERVKVYGSKGGTVRTGRGLFAAALLDRFPILPVEEEGRLNDLPLRENFINRVFAYHRLQSLYKRRFSRRDFVDFHTSVKLLIMAHSPKDYKAMGQLVAAIIDYTPDEFRQKYAELYMTALRHKTTTKKNVNVLQHIMGFLKRELTTSEKRDILSVIDDYHRQLVPLIVPLTLVKHYLRKHDITYVLNQTYLNPSPKELMLRNHV